MKYFSLFSGIGGFEIGIENAYASLRDTHEHEWEHVEASDKPSPQSGGEHDLPVCIGFSEIDRHASAVLRYQFPNTTNYGDITSIDAGILPDFDLLVGGFPCQTFSVAGKRAGFSDTRGTLFFEMARIAKEKKPKYWLAENVKGLVSHDGGKTLKTILSSMQELGYTVSIEILNAKFYGVPQNRERIFMLGWHVPTVCKEVLSGIPQTKKSSFVKITKGFLFQNLLNNLKELQKVSEDSSKDLVCGLITLNAIIEAGRNERWTFSSEISKNLYENLKDCSLKEMKEQFTTRQEVSEGRRDTKAGIPTKGASSSLSAEEKVWESIALLLKDELDDPSIEPNKSITSTLIKQTTKKETFTYAEMLRTIASFTLHLRSSSSHLWNEVLSDLIILKVGTKYEPITDQTEERIIGRSGFVRRSNLPDSLRNKTIIECGSRSGSPREILFERGENKKITSSNQQQTKAVLTPDRIEKRQNGRRFKENGEPMFTLNAQDRHGVMQTLTPVGTPDSQRVYDTDGVSKNLSANGGGEGAKMGLIVNHGVPKTSDQANAMEANYHKGLDNHGQRTGVMVDRQTSRTVRSGGIASPHGSKQCWDSHIVNGRIRRLTPTECERLMSWPDGWTQFGDYGEGLKEISKQSDSARYKMCGNGVVSKVVESIVRELITPLLQGINE